MGYSAENNSGLGRLTDADVERMTQAQIAAIQGEQLRLGRSLTIPERLKIIARVQRSYGLDPKFADDQKGYNPKTNGGGTYTLDSVVNTKPQSDVYWEAVGNHAGSIVNNNVVRPLTGAASGLVSQLAANPVLLLGVVGAAALAFFVATRKR